jgi:predicted dehydrogenase
MQQVKAGLVGYGKAGEIFHAPLITATPGLRLKGFVERHAQRSRHRYPQATIVRSIDELLDDSDIQLVVIATPNTSHYDLAHKALSAGRHVVVDKPFTITSAEADRLIALAEEQNLILSVFHNRRLDGDFQTVQAILRQGLLGRLVHYESAFDRFRNYLKEDAWREQPLPGSGLLYDLGAHLIDQAVQLFGLPSSVTADVRQQRKGAAADDAFDVHLGYDEVKVRLQASILAREPRPRFRLFGNQGSFVKYGLDPQEELLQQGTLPGDRQWGVEPPEQWGTLNTDLGDLHIQGAIETLAGRYEDYYQNVYEAITGNAPLLVNATEARNVIRIIELAQQSSGEQRTIPCDW